MTLDLIADPRTPAARQQLIWAIAVSLLVHVAAVFLLPRLQTSPVPPLPLHVRLVPAARATPPAPPRHVPEATSPTHHALAAPHDSDVANRPSTPAGAPAPTQPSIDLDAVFARARAIAREKHAPTRLGPTKTPVTVESVIARAAKSDTVTETRGADGEWITTNGKRRCVMRTRLKWFEEGVPMLPLCEVTKG